ncbi:Rid family detoxifying hydrolase [Cetobacterium somerae]|uniref:Rid family detoxifying hydrolase n=1 Tax=Cetobacterium somerae TaxID=188913 RepID=UPI003D7675C2
MKNIINTIEAPATINYSQAIEINNTLYLSGQIPLNPKTMELESSNIEKQTQQILDNIQAILKKSNYCFENIIKIITYVTNLDDFIKINKIYNKAFSNIASVRSLIEVSTLPKNSNIMVEIIASK